MEDLERLGLMAEDVPVYQALMAEPCDPAGLAARIGTSVSLLEESLQRLAAVGLVTPQGDGAGTLVAVSADVAVMLLAKQEEGALLRRLGELEDVRRRAPQVRQQLTEGMGALSWDGHMVVRAVDEPIQVLAEQFALSARVRVRRMEPAPAVSGLGTQSDVQQRSLYEREVLDGPGMLDKIMLDVVRGNHSVRVLPHLPLRMIVIDDDAGLVDLGEGAFVLQPSPVLTALINLFDLLWERAIDPMSQAEEQARSEWRISDEDAALLRLLAAGLKDQAIARHLGIGLRTVVRRVGNLSRALDAETRFQTGLQAARRGLL